MLLLRPIGLCATALLLSSAMGNYSDRETCRNVTMNYPVDGFPDDMSICQWNLPQMGLIDQQRPASGEKKVRLAVLAAGVDIDHREIKHALNVSASCSWMNSDNTHIADPRSPICGDLEAISDKDGYGTAIASIIAGKIDGLGIDGVAPDVELVAYKVGIIGDTYFEDILHGIRKAADDDAEIIVVPYITNPICREGGPDPNELYRIGYSTGQEMLNDIQEAVQYAQGKGALIVTGTGISAIDTSPQSLVELAKRDEDGGPYQYINGSCVPPFSSIPDVVTVNGVGPLGINYYSNVGPNVTLTAPSGDELQDWIISPYQYTLGETSPVSRFPRPKLGGVLAALPNSRDIRDECKVLIQNFTDSCTINDTTGTMVDHTECVTENQKMCVVGDQSHIDLSNQIYVDCNLTSEYAAECNDKESQKNCIQLQRDACENNNTESGPESADIVDCNTTELYEATCNSQLESCLASLRESCEADHPLSGGLKNMTLQLEESCSAVALDAEYNATCISSCVEMAEYQCVNGDAHSRNNMLIAGERYAYVHGTAFATALVAGVAALIKQQNPQSTASQLRQALIDRATPRACQDEWEGFLRTLDVRGDNFRPDFVPGLIRPDTRVCVEEEGRSNFFGYGTVNIGPIE